jgi:16S rRNA (uracil1498-N3)-methyltransferase
MRRFFTDPGAIFGDQIRITDKSDIHHMVVVLRMREGDCLVVSDRSETEYAAKITKIGKGDVQLDIVGRQSFKREPHLETTLFQGVPKGQKMDLVVQKSIELGANRIVPLLTLRTEQDFGSQVEQNMAKRETAQNSATRKLERWRRIASETAKQCQRGIIPEISAPVAIWEIVEMAAVFDLLLVLYELEEAVTIKQALRDFRGRADISSAESAVLFPGLAGSRLLTSPRIAIVVGPEGGLEYEEVKALTAAGAVSVSVGKTILRTETAGPVAVAMILYELEML